MTWLEGEPAPSSVPFLDGCSITSPACAQRECEAEEICVKDFFFKHLRLKLTFPKTSH